MTDRLPAAAPPRRDVEFPHTLGGGPRGRDCTVCERTDAYYYLEHEECHKALRLALDRAHEPKQGMTIRRNEAGHYILESRYSEKPMVFEERGNLLDTLAHLFDVQDARIREFRNGEFVCTFEELSL